MLVKKSGVLSLVSSQIVIVRETSLVSTFHSQKQHFSHRNRPFESSFSLLAPSSRPADRSHSSPVSALWTGQSAPGPRLDPHHFLRLVNHPVLPAWATFFTAQFNQRPAHNSSLTARDRIFVIFSPHPFVLKILAIYPSVYTKLSRGIIRIRKKSLNWSACEILENFTGH